ncbi:hypothetical protein ARMSODRAFT_978974 [Armillaria solidipes]|uniref:Uncharacterized protein n=1 Tax=Armillaria solidipes TaxID=1076256 RepID=A0A2H3BNV8_9AGAR|nr:hypothetical protein ARMSODRAFT_978974 [Armillaria solidipes]
MSKWWGFMKSVIAWMAVALRDCAATCKCQIVRISGYAILSSVVICVLLRNRYMSFLHFLRHVHLLKPNKPVKMTAGGLVLVPRPMDPGYFSTHLSLCWCTAGGATVPDCRAKFLILEVAFVWQQQRSDREYRETVPTSELVNRQGIVLSSRASNSNSACWTPAVGDPVPVTPPPPMYFQIYCATRRDMGTKNRNAVQSGQSRLQPSWTTVGVFCLQKRFDADHAKPGTSLSVTNL